MASMEPTMATSTLPASRHSAGQDDPQTARETDSIELFLQYVLMRLASLKIAVTLFIMAIILVVVGTLAQVDKDVWQVVDDFFRTPLAWIDLKEFFPPSFFPGLSVPNQVRLPGGHVVPLGFYFPGGWLIGGLMMINLLAAHLVRFPVQARGIQLKVGWVVVGIGSLFTWMVIPSGATLDGEYTGAWISGDAVWRLLQTGLAIACLVFGFAALRLARGRSLERGLLLSGAALLGGFLTRTLCGTDATRLGDSSLRILWQMCKGQLATLVLLLGCSILYKKKAGLV